MTSDIEESTGCPGKNALLYEEVQNIVKFCVKLALFKCEILRDELTKSWTSCPQMSNESQEPDDFRPAPTCPKPEL